METSPNRYRRGRQDAFLNATTVAELTRLAIDDLEAQCLRRPHRVKAVMTSWAEIDIDDDSYEVCSVCLGGAALLNRGWLDSEDQGMLERMYGSGSETLMSMLDADLWRRLAVLNEIRKLRVLDAVSAMRPVIDAAEVPTLWKRCGDAESRLAGLNARARTTARTRAETGASHLEKDDELSPVEIEDSIRFFRNVVIPELVKIAV